MPGHVCLAPRHLFFHEQRSYPRGSRIESALVASQMLHESRHQKGFFFNRITDPRPVLRPSGFVRRSCHRERFGKPFQDHIRQELFDLMLAVGYEFSYLRFLRENFSFGMYDEPLEMKLQRKRSYFFSLLLEAERHREALTPLGEAALEEMLCFMEH